MDSILLEGGTVVTADRAWRADVNSSSSSGTSFWPPRPIVSTAASSSNLEPSSSAGLLRTTSVPVWIGDGA